VIVAASDNQRRTTTNDTYDIRQRKEKACKRQPTATIIATKRGRRIHPD
jgi:hypothetical protein